MMPHLHATTNKRLAAWSHHAFHQRLESAAELRGVVVHRVPEWGTSGTCGRCGHWNAHLGGALTFRCANPACRWQTDRDVNGARNNLLCALTLALLPAA